MRIPVAVTFAVVVLGAVSAGPAFAASKPVVETLSATHYFATSVTLTGTVNPEGLETNYRFEYGTTTSYGKESADEILLPGTVTVEASKAISGLVTGTTYHYRLIASNSDGTSFGADKTFVAEPVKDEWDVNGAALKSGSSKEFTLKAKSTEPYTFTAACCGGTILKFTSSAVKFKSGKILGGTPGRIEGNLEFENIVVGTPKGCEVVGGKIETYLLNSEIVEESAAKKSTGVIGVVLAPNEGNTMARFETKNKGPETCAWNKAIWSFEGSLLEEVSPQKGEAKVNKLLVKSGGSGEYRNSKGEFKNAGLRWSKTENWVVTGGSEMELVSKEVFGAF